ncbi:hypothetical protein WA158_000393 [Blastocystis sp. Blastoise]
MENTNPNPVLAGTQIIEGMPNNTTFKLSQQFTELASCSFFTVTSVLNVFEYNDTYLKIFGKLVLDEDIYNIPIEVCFFVKYNEFPNSYPALLVIDPLILRIPATHPLIASHEFYYQGSYYIETSIWNKWTESCTFLDAFKLLRSYMSYCFVKYFTDEELLRLSHIQEKIPSTFQSLFIPSDLLRSEPRGNNALSVNKHIHMIYNNTLVDVKIFYNANKQEINEAFRELYIYQMINNKYVLNIQGISFTADLDLCAVLDATCTGTLRDYIKTTKPRMDVRMNICTHLIDGLKEIYNLGFVHRNISMDSIYLCENIFKYGDFGHSKEYYEKEVIPIDSITFTIPINIRAPRAISDIRCDIYALTMVIYELLVGSPLCVQNDFNILFQNIPDKEKVPTMTQILEDKIKTRCPESLRKTIENNILYIADVNPEEAFINLNSTVRQYL